MPRLMPKAVDECSGGFRIIHCYHQHALVEVGGKDMRLFGQVGRTSDDVILPVFDFIDESRAFLIQYDLHVVAYRHRIGATDTFQTEVTFDFTFNVCSFVGLYQIPTPCILITSPLKIVES